MGEPAHADGETAAPPGPKRVVLRLDDGSLIGDGVSLLGNGATGAVLLDYERACVLGRVSQKDLERLESLIATYQEKVPEWNTLNQSQLRHHNPYRDEGQRALKRLRSLPNGDHFGSGPTSPQASAGTQPLPTAAPAPPPPPAADGAGADFAPRCRDVLSKVYTCIGPKEVVYNLPARDVFYRSIDETFPTIAEDYKRRIARPITLREIERRLSAGRYASPQAFCDDVRLVWANCRQYTPDPNQPIHRLANRLAAKFEEAWAATGFSADARARRTTAGMAAARFNDFEIEDAPLVPAPPPQQQQPKPPRSGGKAQRPGGGRGVGGGGAQPARSHEVSSQQEGPVLGSGFEERAVPRQLLEEVAMAIQNLDGDDMQAALDLMNEGVVVVGEDGSAELDFEKITYEALLAVDAYIRKATGQPPREEEEAAGPAGALDGAQPTRSAGLVRMDQSDSDYDGEEDSGSE